MSRPLSLRKAAAHCHFPSSTFGSYVRTGRGPRHVRVGNVYRFEISDLDDWIRAHTVGASQ